MENVRERSRMDVKVYGKGLNQLNVDIYIAPTKTAEYIQFTTVVTRTGVSFSDVQLKYA